MRGRITLLTGNHLCHNPRVLKEASTLSEAGWNVDVLGAWFDADLKQRDCELLAREHFTFTPVVDFTSSSRTRLVGRAKSKVGGFVYRMAWLENDWQLSPVVDALKKAGHETDADLFIAHSEPGMVAVCDLLNKGKRVGVDMEDWYSEDLLPEARKRRPTKLLRALEARLLIDGVHSTCPSRAMSEALCSAYRCKPPLVVYNAFRWSDRKQLDGLVNDRHNLELPSIHWYSQTLGFGRGLEDLIGALPFLDRPAEIHLRGRPADGFTSWLNSHLRNGWRDRVFVHDLVSNDELLSRIAEHDIGFAGEQTYCRSREVTVTNKILHYLLGGLAVIASETMGQCEIAERAPGAVQLYRVGDPRGLAAKLDYLLSSPEDLANTKKAALVSAKEAFNWESQSSKLVASVSTALAASR